MTELTKGANAPLETSTIELAVVGTQPGAVDLMVLQLTAAGKVRSDDDFVFYNQPASPEGAVRLDGERITAQLDGVPADIERLAVCVAMDDGAPGSLATAPSLAVTVTAGGQQVEARGSGFTSERAAILVEVYRRNGAWKVRNVSAGWDGGLVALASEHGVSVEEPAPGASGGWPAQMALLRRTVEHRRRPLRSRRILLVHRVVRRIRSSLRHPSRPPR